MNAPVSHGYGYRDPSRRIKGIVVVLVVHALIGYALVYAIIGGFGTHYIYKLLRQGPGEIVPLSHSSAE